MDGDTGGSPTRPFDRRAALFGLLQLFACVALATVLIAGAGYLSVLAH